MKHSTIMSNEIQNNNTHTEWNKQKHVIPFSRILQLCLGFLFSTLHTDHYFVTYFNISNHNHHDEFSLRLRIWMSNKISKSVELHFHIFGKKEFQMEFFFDFISNQSQSQLETNIIVHMHTMENEHDNSMNF